MAGFVAQGSTFSFAFGGTQAETSVVLTATRLSVEQPTAEYVNMTSALSTATANLRLVPTGDWLSHGAVSVDFICGTATMSLRNIVGKSGTLSFTGLTPSLTLNAIAESGEVTAGVGQVTSGRAVFRITTHTGW
jgi:hypothetical protein